MRDDVRNLANHLSKIQAKNKWVKIIHDDLQKIIADELERNIKAEKEFVVYDYRPIRKEIREIPKITKLSKKARIRILRLYDSITGNHFLKNFIEVANLARKYYDCYRNLGGIYGWDTSIRIDFMIVACASINKLDIVYSADNKTLLSKPALKAYKHINIKENQKLPTFFTYEELLVKFRNLNPSI